MIRDGWKWGAFVLLILLAVLLAGWTWDEAAPW